MDVAIAPICRCSRADQALRGVAARRPRTRLAVFLLRYFRWRRRALARSAKPAPGRLRAPAQQRPREQRAAWAAAWAIAEERVGLLEAAARLAAGAVDQATHILAKVAHCGGLIGQHQHPALTRGRFGPKRVHM